MRGHLVFWAGLSLVVGACTREAGPTVTETTVQAAEVAAIRFAAGSDAVTPSIPLSAGGYVELVYEPDRFYALVDREAEGGFFAEHHHCYGQGCCAASFPEVEVHYRFDDTGTFDTAPMGVHHSFALELPPSAERLEVYFSVPGFDLTTWYCGCDEACASSNRAAAPTHWIEHQAWDSLWGRNYIFEVDDADAPLPVVQRLADGQWATHYEATPDGEGWTWHANLWIDFLLAPQGQDHRAGVRWTTDLWNTWQDTQASRERHTPTGREVWGIDLTPVTTFTSCPTCTPESVRVEYAIFYEVDGHTYWDNNQSRNYAVVLNPSYQE